jgi:Secretion system C-terminal sorting domain
MFAQLVSNGGYESKTNSISDNLSTDATYVIDKNSIPAYYSLEQNYPNPFNPSTKITFSLPEISFVKLRVFNAIGLEVKSLINGMMPAGIHEVDFDATELFSGVYFYTLNAGNFVQTRKMILIK